MNHSFRSFIAAALIGACAVFAMSACGTGSGAADSGASTPASSHFKADLAAGYGAVQAVRVATTSALQAHAITADQAQAVATQANAFTATLDVLRAAGASPGNQTTLTATLAAISAATVFVTASQGVPKS